MDVVTDMILKGFDCGLAVFGLESDHIDHNVKLKIFQAIEKKVGIIPVPTNTSNLGAQIIGCVAPIEQRDIMPILKQSFGDMIAEKTGSSYDKNLHAGLQVKNFPWIEDVVWIEGFFYFLHKVNGFFVYNIGKIGFFHDPDPMLT